MSYGYAGKTLEVDLSRGRIEKVSHDPALAEDFLGGKGTNAKLLWDRVPPEVESFSCDSLLIIGIGVLTGTIVPSASRGVITAKSPATGLHHHSAVGGFWPAQVKHAGYDTIVVRGKSSIPVYLWINNGRVELRDAAHLWGKGTREVGRIIRKELNNDRVQIACIGQAGENKVYGASIACGHGASASRGGLGAIMGDKQLKAIAVYGTGDVNVAESSRLIELCEEIIGRSGPLRKVAAGRYGQDVYVGHTLDGFLGNLDEVYQRLPEDSAYKQACQTLEATVTDWINKKKGRPAGCHNCGIDCGLALASPDGGYLFHKCQTWVMFTNCCKLIDYEFVLECSRLCEDYGLDSVSIARCIAFAIQLYEKGILTDKDTDGLRLEWGNAEVALSLINKIGRREGIGEMLADGVYLAARHLGNGAEEFAYHTKKLEYVAPATFMFQPYYALAQAISDKADFSRNVSGLTTRWRKGGEDKQAVIKSEGFVYPKGYEKYYLADFSLDGTDYEPGCQFAAYDAQTFTITDITGLCNITTVFWPCDLPVNSRSLIAELVSCVTGMDIDETRLTEIARRAGNLIRAYNVRLGAGRKDDTVSKLFFQTTPQPPLQRLDPDKFDRWIDRYYELEGWSNNGVPARETLERFGLDYVRQDLESRGVYR